MGTIITSNKSNNASTVFFNEQEGQQEGPLGQLEKKSLFEDPKSPSRRLDNKSKAIKKIDRQNLKKIESLISTCSFLPIILISLGWAALCEVCEENELIQKQEKLIREAKKFVREAKKFLREAEKLMREEKKLTQKQQKLLREAEKPIIELNNLLKEEISPQTVSKITGVSLENLKAKP